MIYKCILLYICITPFIPAYNGQKMKEHYGLFMKSNSTTLLFQDPKALFVCEETPVWEATIDARNQKMTYIRQNIMSKVTKNLGAKNKNFKKKSSEIILNSKKITNFPIFDTHGETNGALDETFSCEGEISNQTIDGYDLSPSTVYPEILVFVHTSFYVKFNNMEETIAYVLTLLNAVDLNYRQAKEPEVRLNIAGIVIVNDRIGTSFENDDEAASKFVEHLHNIERVDSRNFYDIAILIKAKTNIRETCTLNSAPACSTKGKFDAIVYDDMMFSGIRHLTVALGYLFGAGTDGLAIPTYMNGPYSKACSYNHGFIMGYFQSTKKQFFFSTCSTQRMIFFFSLINSACLRNDPSIGKNYTQMTLTFPSKFLSLDEQCQSMGFKKAAQTDSRVCLNLLCIDTSGHNHFNNILALEGSPCGNNMHCLRGECEMIKEEMFKVEINQMTGTSSLDIVYVNKRIGMTIKAKEGTTLVLQEADILFAGSNTRIWEARNKAHHNGQISYVLKNDRMREVMDAFAVYGNNEDYQRSNPLNSTNLNFSLEFISRCYNLHVLQSEIQNKSNLMPNTVYPKILVFVNNSLFAGFNNNFTETIVYVLTLLSGVDLNFRIMDQPKVRLNIVGIVIVAEQLNVPYNKEDHLFSEFSFHLNNTESIESDKFYDISVLINGKTKGDTCVINSPSACSASGKFDLIVYDDLNFLGIHFLTVALAYLFGAQEDGKATPTFIGGPNSESCPYNDGYLMGVETENNTKFLFSLCSQRMMSYFFSLKISECLHNITAMAETDKQILRILPGKYLSLHEQCQMRGFTKAVEPSPSTCSSIECITEPSLFGLIPEPALEGSTCGSRKHCIRGKCIQVEVSQAVGNINKRNFLSPSFTQLRNLRSIPANEDVAPTLTKESISSSSILISNNTKFKLLLFVSLLNIFSHSIYFFN